MPDSKHPIWKLAAVLIVGCLGLGYCSIAYQNSVDPLKDGGLIALVGGLSAAAMKLFSNTTES